MTNAGNRFAPYADRLLALAFVAVTQLEIWVFDPSPERSAEFQVAVTALTIIASSALAFRRTRPVIAFIVNGLAVYGAIAVGMPSDFYQWTNLVATYSIAAHGSVQEAWLSLPFSVGGVLYYFIRFPNEGGVVVAGFAVAMWLVAWLAGRMYGSRVEEMRLRGERDLSLQIAETQRERLAMEEERGRIARELHDIIGHSVNVMVLHAGAGRRALSHDSETAGRAFETIEETGRSALGELDRVLAILRRDDATADLAPPPGLDQLAELAGTFAEAGLPVELAIKGQGDGVPPSVGLSAYRIAQEALTNVLKHANARQARVDIDVDAGSLRLSVVDDGLGLVDGVAAGRGISGMKERAAIHGGTLEISSIESGTAVSTTLHWEVEG